MAGVAITQNIVKRADGDLCTQGAQLRRHPEHFHCAVGRSGELCNGLAMAGYNKCLPALYGIKQFG